jgi:hypothetical protein
MTFYQRLRAAFSSTAPAKMPLDLTTGSPSIPLITGPSIGQTPSPEPIGLVPSATPAMDPLPGWLADEDALRDEGVLFGVSDTRPDGKINQIRFFFARQTASLTELVEENTEKIGELNLLIEQRETSINTLRNQIDDLLTREPRPSNLPKTSVSLLLSIVLCICNFYLIDETLRPVFPNRLIGLGVFMAGMFNLFSRTSFFYEEGTRLSVRRVVAEAGLPLAASVFILAQALQTQPLGQAVALFVFTFLLFLLAGNLFLSNLTTLQTDLRHSELNRQSNLDKVQKIPVWEGEIDRLTREVDAIRLQKWPIVTTLNRIQADITRLNTKRDELVNLFVSEYELARSLRDRLSEQQRKGILNDE